MNVLALDLATRTGWALVRNGHIESGVQVFDIKRGESPGMRYLRFRVWLEGITADSVSQAAMVDLIVYEQTVPAPAKFSSASTREIASGFATRVQEQCAALGIDHVPVYPSTLKKFVTGKGNAKKLEVIDTVIRRGWVPRPIRALDDNEADAIALLYYARAWIVPTVEGESARLMADSRTRGRVVGPAAMDQR